MRLVRSISPGATASISMMTWIGHTAAVRFSQLHATVTRTSFPECRLESATKFTWFVPANAMTVASSYIAWYRLIHASVTLGWHPAAWDSLGICLKKFSDSLIDNPASLACSTRSKIVSTDIVIRFGTWPPPERLLDGTASEQSCWWTKWFKTNSSK